MLPESTMPSHVSGDTSATTGLQSVSVDSDTMAPSHAAGSEHVQASQPRWSSMSRWSSVRSTYSPSSGQATSPSCHTHRRAWNGSSGGGAHSWPAAQPSGASVPPQARWRVRNAAGWRRTSGSGWHPPPVTAGASKKKLVLAAHPTPGIGLQAAVRSSVLCTAPAHVSPP